MDTKLAAGLARDLDGSFEALVVAHQDRLYTLAVRFLGNPSDAEEATQDAFVRAYRALASYDAERIRDLQLKGWLATIVLNVCRNRVRRHEPVVLPLEQPPRSGAASGGSTGDASVDTPADHLEATEPRSIPHESVVRREGAETWARLVVALPERYRAPILLRHVDGLSYDEMSQALDRPEGTLKAQVHRGLALLRTAAERARVLEHEEMTA
jgi:RNA polymerase sigma-70 factor (ECF subfamily)